MPFGWFSVGYVEDFPTGSARATYYFDRHLVAWRDDRGEMHVQDAFCPHLGAHLGHGGTVEGCELRCPFHGWKFDAEGTNTDIPYSDRVNRKAQLRTYPVAERNGFVLVWYHPDEKPPSWDEWADVTRRAVERYHRPDEGISICPAPSGPQRCTDEMLAGCAALADELDLMIHIHVLETRMQAVSGRRMYGRTLPEHMDALGFLSPRVCFEHGIWLTPSDVELVRDRGVTIVHNPVSNL
jgi:nitrite reductase/ring-hydroxylating ferredoxin subunit